MQVFDAHKADIVQLVVHYRKLLWSWPDAKLSIMGLGCFCIVTSASNTADDNARSPTIVLGLLFLNTWRSKTSPLTFASVLQCCASRVLDEGPTACRSDGVASRQYILLAPRERGSPKRAKVKNSLCGSNNAARDSVKTRFTHVTQHDAACLHQNSDFPINF